MGVGLNWIMFNEQTKRQNNDTCQHWHGDRRERLNKLISILCHSTGLPAQQDSIQSTQSPRLPWRLTLWWLITGSTWLPQQLIWRLQSMREKKKKKKEEIFDGGNEKLFMRKSVSWKQMKTLQAGQQKRLFFSRWGWGVALCELWKINMAPLRWLMHSTPRRE